MMHLLRRLGSVTVADLDVPKTWEGAARWFLGGTIIFASGFEAVVMFWEGKFLFSLGSFLVAIFLLAILIYWDLLKGKIPRATDAFTAASKDGRLWAVMLLVIAESSRFPSNVWQESWLYGLPLFVAVLLFFASWKYLSPPHQKMAALERDTLTSDPPPVVTVEKAPGPVDLPKQARLDLLHLFAFAVTQTTVAMLDGLIKLERLPEAAESEATWDSPQKGTDWYVGFVRQRLGDGTDRKAKFNSMLQVAAVEAEQKIEAIPIDQRPDGVDPLKLRRRQIVNLQRERTVQFLRNEKREAEESLVSQRTKLINLFDRWQKAIGG
jgi:hypothetical protein